MLKKHPESHSIKFGEMYEQLLIKLGKIDEARKLTDRDFELEEVQGRSRGTEGGTS